MITGTDELLVLLRRAHDAILFMGVRLEHFRVAGLMSPLEVDYLNVLNELAKVLKDRGLPQDKGGIMMTARTDEFLAMLKRCRDTLRTWPADRPGEVDYLTHDLDHYLSAKDQFLAEEAKAQRELHLNKVQVMELTRRSNHQRVEIACLHKVLKGDRPVYRWFDGRDMVSADPVTLHQRYSRVVATLRVDLLIMNSQSNSAETASVATDTTIRDIFSLRTPEEGGPSRKECLDLLQHFLRYCEELTAGLP